MEFRILGPLEVWDGSRHVSLTGPKQRALLAALLLRAGEPVSSDHLLDELWDDDRAGGVQALRVRVSQLRKALGEHVIETHPGGYAVKLQRGQLDLQRFEMLAERGSRALESGEPALASQRLGEALSLWRGPPLADLADEGFAQAAVARLGELRLRVLELRVEADMQLGRHAELLPELEELVAEHPLHEGLRRYQMLALYRSGRQADGLAVYREARRTLVEELGIEPGPALQELERAILRHDAALEPSGRLPRGATAEGAPDRAILLFALAEAALLALAELAGTLARQPASEVIVVALARAESDLEAASASAHRVRNQLEGRGVIARAAAFTSGEPGVDLVRLAQEQDVDLVLAEAPRTLLWDGAIDRDLAAMLEHAPCDVAVLLARAGRPPSGPVIVPFSGVEHDWAAVELGAWMAGATGAPLRVLGATGDPQAGKRDASRLLAHVSLAIQRALGVVAEPLLVASGPQGILEAASEGGLLVVGLSSRWHREGLGQARLALARDAAPPTLLVRRGLRPGALAPRSALTQFTWSVPGTA